MFEPEAQGQGEVAFLQGDHGAHRQRLGTAVQGAGALGGSVRPCGGAGRERGPRLLPKAGGAALDEQHLAQVGAAAVAFRAAAVAGAAGGASLHGGYSR